MITMRFSQGSCIPAVVQCFLPLMHSLPWVTVIESVVVYLHQVFELGVDGEDGESDGEV